MILEALEYNGVKWLGKKSVQISVVGLTLHCIKRAAYRARGKSGLLLWSGQCAFLPDETWITSLYASSDTTRSSPLSMANNRNRLKKFF